MNLQDARAKAAEISSKVEAGFEGFQNVVKIIHSDGSVFFYNHAFIVLMGDWIAVIPEHYEPIVFLYEDVYDWAMYGINRKIHYSVEDFE